jgi:uncharacterized protein (TIGR03083 family)
MTIDDQLAVEYRNARLRMQAIAADLDDGAAAAVVPACPAWTVRDLFSHVAGIATDLAAGNTPAGGDTQAWVDRQIAERSSTSLAEVVEEWSRSGPAFEALLEAMPRRLWGLTYDTVVHEHDLRNATGRPGERDSEGVRVAAELGLRLVAADLAKAGLGAFRAVLDGVEHVVGEGDVGLTLTASSFDALRLLGSRRTLAELRAAAFEGDLDRHLPGLIHMTMPVATLGE